MAAFLHSTLLKDDSSQIATCGNHTKLLIYVLLNFLFAGFVLFHVVLVQLQHVTETVAARPNIAGSHGNALLHCLL